MINTLLTPQLYNQVSYYNKARIKKYGDYVVLVSYTTEIVKLNITTKAIKWLCNERDLTQTTLKHLKDFLYQYRGMNNLTKKEILEMMED